MVYIKNKTINDYLIIVFGIFLVSLLIRYHVNYERPQGTGDIPIQAEARGGTDFNY